MNEPIGIFDSGLGGLTVLKEITKALPDENLCYLGDTARVPYGTKGSDTVIRYCFDNASFLLNYHIKLLVVACNTASAYALEELQSNLDIPVIGVVVPGSVAAAKVTKTNKVGIIGTQATINSEAYIHAIRNIDKEIEVCQTACPLFVPVVEEGLSDADFTKTIASHYLENFNGSGIDTLILGCTHYPLLKDVIGNVLGPKVNLIDSAKVTAQAVKETIIKEKLQNFHGDNKGTHKFFVTDSPEKFVTVGSSFYGEKLDEAELIKLEEI